MTNVIDRRSSLPVALLPLTVMLMTLSGCKPQTSTAVAAPSQDAQPATRPVPSLTTASQTTTPSKLKGGEFRIGVLPDGRIEIEAEQVEGITLIQAISIKMGINVVGRWPCRDPVSIRMYDVNPLTALDAIAQMHGYGVYEEGGFVYCVVRDGAYRTRMRR